MINELERKLKADSMQNLRYHELKKTMKTLRQHHLSPGQDLNLKTHEYEASVLNTRKRRCFDKVYCAIFAAFDHAVHVLLQEIMSVKFCDERVIKTTKTNLA
jgi:hypothetical protein